MSQLDDPFSIGASIFVLIMTVVMFIVVTRMYSAMKNIDADDFDRAAMLKANRRMMYAVGLWQISVGLLLIAYGHATATAAVSLIGFGILISIGTHYGLFTGEWPQRNRDD